MVEAVADTRGGRTGALVRAGVTEPSERLEAERAEFEAQIACRVDAQLRMTSFSSSPRVSFRGSWAFGETQIQSRETSTSGAIVPFVSTAM
jgi:hypothetical protein